MTHKVEGSTARRTEHRHETQAPTAVRAADRRTSDTPRDGVDASQPPRLLAVPAFLRPIAAVLAPLMPAPARGLTATSASILDGPVFPPAPVGLGVGDSSRKVKRAEQMLKRAGFSPGKVDREFSTNTEKALKQFQASVGLEATGRLDDRTFSRLERVNARVKKHGGDQVGAGQKGERIENIERRLKKLGYDTGRVDGVFDRQTGAAVVAFKKDQPEIKGEHAVLGERGQRSLKREADALGHDPRHIRKPVKTRAQREHLQRLDARVADAARKVNADGTVGFGQGSRGKSVEYVQQHLRAAGFDPQRTGGVFDERTEGALRAYQRREGIPVTGRVDRTTWSHLKTATLEARGATDPKQMIDERSGAVRNTEKLLKKLGHKTGKVDGLYTEQTERAVDAFRRKHDMDRADGVGPGTLKALKKAVKNQNPFGRPMNVAAWENGRQIGNIKVVRVNPPYTTGGESELVRQDVAKVFLKMRKAAAKDGVNLQIVDGFRTYSEQKYLYDNGYPANPPGYSNHQNGRALDLNVVTGGSMAVGTGAVYNWLARNAGRFGFQRIPSEAWHWEYKR